MDVPVGVCVVDGVRLCDRVSDGVPVEVRLVVSVELRVPLVVSDEVPVEVRLVVSVELRVPLRVEVLLRV